MITEYVSTEGPSQDQWQLATYHYTASQKKHPVILIHGFGTNRFDVDFPEKRYSLAKYLHAQGYDTWVIELRGTGQSRRTSLLGQIQSKLCYNWTFDDHIFKDIPVLVKWIQKKTGQKKLHWIGHSLGGTVVYASIETLGNEVCASAVTLGSAMNSTAKIGLIHLLLKIDPLVKKLPLIPLKTLARTLAPAGRWMAPLEDNFFYAIDNVDMKIIEVALRQAVENVSPALFLQLHDWYRNNHFRAHDRNFSYRDHLKKIKAPFLVCAGSVDGLTGYPDVYFGFKNISSKKKKFLLFGKEKGCRTEYGHLDLVLGKNAPREVFPQVLNWLDQNDS